MQERIGRGAPLRVLSAVLYIGIAMFELRGLLGGGPFYIHDWGWPLLGAQLREAIFTNATAWDSSGVGGPAVAPLLHPVFVLWTALGYPFSPAIVSDITLTAAFAAFAGGVAYSATVFGVRPGIAIGAGAIAEAGPALLNKLAAGHVYYIISLACLSWVLGLALERGDDRSRRFFLSGALCAMAALQIQLYAAGLLGLAAAATMRASISWKIRLCSLLLAFTLPLPEFVSVMSPAVIASSQHQKTTTLWLANNSAPFPRGLVQLGYAPHYAERALFAPVAQFTIGALWLCFALAAITALVLSIRSRRIAVLAGGGVIATLLVLGTNGPLAGPLTATAPHSLAASVFRELYHFAGIAWLCEMVLAAIALDVFPVRISAGISIVIFIAASSFWWSPSLSGVIQKHSLPLAAMQQLQKLRSAPGDYRFLASPAEWPVSEKGALSGGAFPLDYAIGNHDTANEYRLSGPLELGVAFAREGDLTRARSWLEASGVGAIAVQPNLRFIAQGRFPPPAVMPAWLTHRIDMIERTPANVPVRPTCMLCAYKSLPLVTDVSSWSGGDAFVQPPVAPSPCDPLPAEDRSADPSVQWIPVMDWQWLDARFAALSPGALFTWSHSVLVLQACKTVTELRVAVLKGNLALDGRRIPLKGGFAHFRLFPGVHRLQVTGGAAAVEVMHKFTGAHSRSTFARAEIHSFYDWRFADGTAHVSKSAQWLVLKTAYAPAWRISIDGGKVLRHVRISGYANGWRVKLDRDADVHVWYARELPIHVLQLICLAIWTAAVVLTLDVKRWAPRDSLVGSEDSARISA